MSTFLMIVMIFVYLSLIVIISSYVFSIFLKNYKYAKRFEYLIFVGGLVVAMILSWSLVIMNKGYNINYYITKDYNWIIILYIAMMIFFIVTNQIERRKSNIKLHIVESIAKQILPAVNSIIFAFTTFVFYFGCHYFTYLSTLNM